MDEPPGLETLSLELEAKVLFTLHCLIEDTCLLFSRTAFLLDTFYWTLDEHLKDQHVYYCILDFD